MAARAKKKHQKESATVRVLKKEIDRIKKQLADIKALEAQRPFERIIEIRQEASRISEECGRDYGKMVKLLEPLAEEEKALRKIADKQMDPKLLDREFALEDDLHDLEQSLFYVQMRHSR
jgi:predicted hydrocarbon binding protein